MQNYQKLIILNGRNMKFYDLSGADNKRFSPFGWRVRMSLAHLDMEEHTEVELVKFSQKDKIKVFWARVSSGDTGQQYNNIG